MLRLTSTLALLTFFVGAAASAADTVKLDDVKCPVSGQAASAEHAVAYKEGKVYFCCPNCPKAFAANTEKFAAKANKQLVLTGQYVQKACPFAGRPVAEKTGSDPEIGFCCKNCLGKYNGMDDAAKLEAVFADAPFAKGFDLKGRDE